MSNRAKGILLMILSSLSFALMSIAVKMTGGTIPVFEQVFFRNIVIILMVLPAAIREHTKIFFKGGTQLLLWGRSVLGVIGVIFSFLATNSGNQADVSILSRLSPFLITILSFFIMHEKITKVQIPALILAFTGAFIIANPKFNSNMYPIVMALLTSLVSSFAYTIVGYLRGKALPNQIVLHFAVVSVLIMIPCMIFISGFVVPTWRELLWLILIGIFGTGGQVFLTNAYRLAETGEVSIYSNSTIIFSALLGYFVLGETLAWNTVIGGLLVISALLIVFIGGKIEKKKLQEKEKEDA